MQITDIDQTRRDAALLCSVGIMAYNEAANIGATIESILNQRLEVARIDEVIVVASGCTDDTVPIAASYSRQDPRVRVVVQERREGKASAINLFMREARSPVLLMVSGDVLVKDGTVEALLHHFLDPTVGMVGAHPVPVNDQATFLGHAVHLIWRLHHRVALERPKLGEAVAFRNVLSGIPPDTPVDEISIEALITQLKYRLLYEPKAIVYNRGPATVSDFLKQRRRIAAGHLQIRQQQGYSAATMSVWRAGRALLSTKDAFTTPRSLCWTAGAVALEAWARALGAADYRRRHPHHLWQIAASTKSSLVNETDTHRPHSVLVFRIVDFHRHELELGKHRAHLFHRGVSQQIRRALGPIGTVSTESAGTIVVVLPQDRAEAEARAQRLIETIEASPIPLTGDRQGIRAALTCGIIAFLQGGDALALAVPRRDETARSA